MMVKVDIGQALGAGLRVIQRKPLAPPVWGLVYFICAYLPSTVIFALVLPDFTQQAAAGGTPDPSKLMAAMAPIQLANMLQLVLGLVAFSVVNAAVCRAVLEPENDRNLYLRLGSQELWQGLVLLVTTVLIGIGMVIALIPVMVIGIGVGVAASQGGASNALVMIPVFFLIMLVVFAGVFYVWLRLSMALPMSFVHRQFRLFESWTFTKGNVARLFGLGLLVMLVVILVEIVIGLLVLGLGFGVLTASGELETLRSVGTTPAAEWLPRLILWLIPMALLFSVLIGYVMASAMAPWADAYRQIAGPNYADVFSDGPAPPLA